MSRPFRFKPSLFLFLFLSPTHTCEPEPKLSTGLANFCTCALVHLQCYKWSCLFQLFWLPVLYGNIQVADIHITTYVHQLSSRSPLKYESVCLFTQMIKYAKKITRACIYDRTHLKDRKTGRQPLRIISRYVVSIEIGTTAG